MLGLIAKLKIREGRMDEALDLFKGLVAAALQRRSEA
jgi:quinol monooxygenase YgiN